MESILLSGKRLCLDDNIDPEEVSFYFWLSGSKEWVKRYGINAVIEMMMRENYTTESYDVE